MSVPLKIKIVRTDQTKVMKFAPTMSIAECCREIREKTNEGGEDHSLFQPASEGKRTARWLRPDRTLQYYDLQPNDEIHYKKKHRPLKVKLPDGTIKTVLIDDTLSVSEIVKVIGDKLNISSPEEFSLKEEGKENWLSATQSLHEQGVNEDVMLCLKQKFFVSPASVSLDDPVSLHLVYVESRDAIVSGNHPCLQDEAILFAALQCQINLGNWNKDRTVNAKDYLPLQFQKNYKKLEPAIVREYKNYVGMKELNAKYRFVQLCRSLKTYGITFFTIKRKKDKLKKPVVTLFGVTRDALLFMEPETKEVEKEYPITHLRRWAASPTTFTLDFGDHEDDYMLLQTTEGDAISSLLAGYIDILLKKRNDPAQVVERDDSQVASEEPVAPIRSIATSSVTTSIIGGYDSFGGQQQTLMTGAQYMSKGPSLGAGAQRAIPTNMLSAQSFVAALIGDLAGKNNAVRNTALTPQQWRKQLLSNTDAVLSSVAKFGAALPPNALDRTLMDQKAAEIAANLAQLVSAARNAALKKDGSEDVDLLMGAKLVADAIKELLDASKELADHPDDPRAMTRYQMAQKALQAATFYLQGASQGMLSDMSSQRLLMESAKHVASVCQDFVAAARTVNPNDPNMKRDIEQTERSSEQLTAEAMTLAPAILLPGPQKQIETSARTVESLINQICMNAKVNMDDSSALAQAARAVSDALSQLLASTHLAEPADTNPEFAEAARIILDESARLLAARHDSQAMSASTKTVVQASTRLVGAAKGAADAVDNEQKDRLLACAKAVAEATRRLVAAAGTSASNPSDEASYHALQDAVSRLTDATQSLVGDAGEKAAMRHLRSAAKVAAAATTGLVATARVSLSTCNDPVTNENLKNAGKIAADAIQSLVNTLEYAWRNPNDTVAQDALVKQAHDCSPLAYKLVAASKSALPKVTDATNKQNLKQAADEAGEALQKLVSANKAVLVSKGSQEIEEALEMFAAEEANLDSAIIEADTGMLSATYASDQSSEGALQLLNLATKDVAGTTKRVATVAKTSPDELGSASKALANSIVNVNTAAKVLAGSLPFDKQVQTTILEGSKALTREARNVVSGARAVASNPSDPNLNGLLAESARQLAEALTNLLNSAKGGHTAGKDCEDAIAIITASLNALRVQPSDPKEFSNYAEDLENNVKAVQAAVFALVNAAKNNPKALGGAAKTTAGAVPPLIESAGNVSGACQNEDTQLAIMDATQNVTQDLTAVLAAAKLAAVKDDPKYGQDLLAASNAVSESLTKLLSAVNSATPGQRGLDDALRQLAHATALLNQSLEGGRAESVDALTQLTELKRATAKLGEATKGIMLASRGDVEKIGGHSKDAATSVSDIVSSTRGLVLTSGRGSKYDSDAQKVKDAAKELVDHCLSKDPAAKQGIIKAAKDVTMATQALVESVKKDATQLGPDVQQAVIQVVQGIATSTSQVVNAAKAAASNPAGAKDHLADTQNALNNAVDNLTAQEWGKVVSDKAQKLVVVAREASTATTAMVEISKNVLKQPNSADAKNELSNAARNVGAAIKSLLEAAKSMNEIDLDECIERIAAVITELDSAAISATVGLLENTAPPGKTTQMLEEELVGMSRELATSIKELVHAQRQSPTALAKAARHTASWVPKIADIAKQSAGSMTSLDQQQHRLSLAKSIADSGLELLQGCKQNDAKEIATQAKNASQAIAKLLSSLKGGVIALRDCDEASKSITDVGKQLEQPTPASDSSSKSYAESQRALTTLAKELVEGIAKVVSTAKNTPHEVGEASKKVAGIMPKFVASTSDALTSVTEPSAQQGLLDSAKAVVATSAKIIQNAKLVASDTKNARNQQLMSAVYKEVTDAIAALVASIKAGATGELKCEAAIESVHRFIAELDAAALYAATGQLQPERDDMDLEQVQNDLILACKATAEQVSEMVSAVDQSQNELGDAAQDTMEKVDKLFKDTKALAALLNNLLNQQELLMGAKGVGMSVQNVVTSAVTVHKAPEDKAARTALSDAAKKVSEAIRDLATLAQNVSSAASLGIKEIETARKGILQMLDEFNSADGNNQAGAADVLKAAKGIADAVAALNGAVNVTGEDSSKLIQAAIDTLDSSRDLFANAKGVLRLCQEKEHGPKLMEAVKSTLDATSLFLDAAKTQRKQGNAENMKRTSDASDEVVKMIGEVVEASRVLPGSEEALRLFQQQDELEQLAERELLNAASAIEDAARTLLEAKQRQLEMRKNRDSPLPEEEITEAIIDAARAITSATGTLVNAATAAQKELVAKGLVSKQQSVYRRDPAWAKGLISAAQAVAGTVGDLVTAANGAAQGKAQEESLVAAAKGVAAATARLVFASRAKADPFSPTQKKLSAAAKAVAAATQSLVAAAKSASQLQEEDDNRPKLFNPEEGSQALARKQEMDQRVKILELEKQLQKERQRLGEIHKSDYKGAGANQITAGVPLPPPINNNNKSSAPQQIPPPVQQPQKPLVRSSSKPAKATYTIEELKAKPPGVDSNNMESYLTEEDFKQAFGMERAAFAALPAWKRNDIKKKLGLY